MRRYFLRRVGLFVASFFVLVFAASALSAALFSSGFEPGDRRGHFFLPAIIGLILLFIGFVVVARAVRRMAIPVADVMEAADRVAGGDYMTRVEARGPREMRRLARSFNQMTERLSSMEQQRRTFSRTWRTSCGRRSRSSEGTSKACWTGCTHPTKRISARSWTRRP